MLLWVATVAVLGKDLSVGGLRYGDESAHVMDGVLIHDWIAAGPSAWAHPMEFAERQYAHYPTLGIGTHYPPGFALVEAAFFGLFGIAAVTSRLAVLFFGLGASTAIFLFMRMHGFRAVSALAGVAWLIMPATVEWGRQTMLEVPTLAIMAWSAVAFAWYARRPSWRRLAVVHGCMLASILFKQTAVFVFAAAACAAIGFAGKGIVPRRQAVWTCLWAVMAIVGVTYFLGGHGSKLFRGDATYPDRWSWNVLTGYLQILPDQVGWPVFLCALFGVLSNRAQLGRTGLFLFGWFGACYLMLTVADFKYNRYLYPGLLPFAFWAALGLHRVIEWIPTQRLRLVPAWVAALIGLATARSHNVPLRPDYSAAVLAHRAEMEGRAVLFCGLREGDFVFAVRQHLPWRSAVVVRGSKLFYTCNGRPDLDYESRVESPASAGRLLERYGFELVFVERANRVGVPAEDWLREHLREGKTYRRLASYDLSAGPRPSRRDVALDVYQPVHSPSPTEDYLDVAIPRAGRSVRVELDGKKIKDRGVEQPRRLRPDLAF